jgi:hypothetical protein
MMHPNAAACLAQEAGQLSASSCQHIVLLLQPTAVGVVEGAFVLLPRKHSTQPE